MKKQRAKTYTISAVAEQFELHPQTLRLYEREGLLKPSRSEGNTRLYTDTDLERLEVILSLTRDLGVNLAGVEIILNMREKMDAMQHEFERFFVQHPLTRELAARLLWAVLDADGRPIGACRIAEDGTLADARDDAIEPPADARFAIAHPVRTGADTLAAFGAQFADYEILQPFPQLAREVFALEPGEAEATRLSRVHGRDVATGAVIGMLDQGWLRGDTGDGGMIGTIDRPIGSDGVTASLWLDPGMFVGQLSSTPRQTLGELVLHDAAGHPVPFGRIDPLACSELLRDILRLAPYPTSP